MGLRAQNSIWIEVKQMIDEEMKKKGTGTTKNQEITVAPENTLKPKEREVKDPTKLVEIATQEHRRLLTTAAREITISARSIRKSL